MASQEGNPRRKLFPTKSNKLFDTPFADTPEEEDGLAVTPPVSPPIVRLNRTVFRFDISEAPGDARPSHAGDATLECPPTPSRPKSVSRSPFSKKKHKPRRMSEIPVRHMEQVEFAERDAKLSSSFSVPDLTITPAEEDSNLPHQNNSPRETPATPLRVLRYKTNINPFSPSRGHPTASREIQIPTEKDAVPRYVSDFEHHEELGKGSFGTVVLCLNRTDGWTYAIKKSIYQGKKMKEKFLQEAYALAALGQHEHIVRYYGSWEDKDVNAIYIQLEWCKGGSLKKRAREQITAFHQKELCKIIRHITLALSYMHSKSFGHGDCKPENILVDTPKIEEKTSYKLGDFGQINDSGDGKYLAPEILHFGDDDRRDPEILSKADIFSLGMTILELAFERATGTPLPIKQRSQIKQEDINLPQDMYDPEFVVLLRRMLRRNPDDRPSAGELLADPLIRDDLSWQLHQEQQKSAALQRRLEEIEQELIKYRKMRQGPVLPKRHNKFDMTDLHLHLTARPRADSPTTVTAATAVATAGSGMFPSFVSVDPTPKRGLFSCSQPASSAVFVSPTNQSSFSNLLGDSNCVNLTRHLRSAFSPMNILQTPQVAGVQRSGFLSPQTPAFSPGLSFSFSPPTNP